MNIVSREDAGLAPPTNVRRMSQPARGVYVHHTAGQDPQADQANQTWSGIQRYHQQTRGWADIGYSFGYDPGGRWYEGRGVGVVGAHTSGQNSTSLGLVVMGNYDRQRLDDDVVGALADMVVWLFTRGHLSAPRVLGGHRDAPGAATSCPGANLHAMLPAVQAEVDRRLTEPKPTDDSVGFFQQGWRKNVVDYALEQEWFREPTDWSRPANQFMVAHVARKVHRDLARRMDGGS